MATKKPITQTKGLSLYKVSKDTGISRNTLYAWRDGLYTPKLDKLQKIADYLGVSVAYLLGQAAKPIADNSNELAIDDLEAATLKKVEYVKGEDWLRLIPINPEYAPKYIEGEELEHCRVIGIPKLLIREI